MAPRKPRKPATPRIEFPKGRHHSENPNIRNRAESHQELTQDRLRRSTPPKPAADPITEARRRLDSAKPRNVHKELQRKAAARNRVAGQKRRIAKNK